MRAVDPVPGRSGPPLRVMMTADAVGGVWVFACGLARELAKRNCEVNLVTLGPSPAAHQLRKIAGCPGVTLTITDLALEWADARGSDASRARQVLAGIAHLFGPDVVHVNGFREALSPFSAPTLITAHSCVRSWWLACHRSEPPAAEWSAYVESIARALDSAQGWAAPSEAHRRLVQKLYRPRTSGTAIRNGTSLKVVDASRERFVLAAGRLWDQSKGVATLTAAARAIEWPVKLAGSAERSNGSASAVFGDRTEVLGDLPHDELLDVMARAEIFVSPAVYEPFGLGVLEAAASGCALVLSDIPTFRELWRGAALFFKPGDSEQLQAAVNRLCRDPDLRQSLRQKARTRAQQYPIGATADAYLALYRQLAEPAVATGPAGTLLEAHP